MDTRNMQHIRDTIRLDEQLKRVKPRPKPSAFDGWGPWIAAVILFSFMAWIIGVGVWQMTMDAVNGMVGL